MALALAVAPDDVEVTSVSDYTFGGSASGRRMLAVGINIVFSVVTDTSDNAGVLVSSISAVKSSPASLTAALQGAGLAVNASSLELTQGPTSAAKARPPPGVVLPIVSVIRVSPNASLVNPAVPITLTAVVTSSSPASSLVMLWSVVPAAALNLSDSSRVGTPLNTSVLGLLPGALTPGASYAFRLSVRDAFGNASSSVLVNTMSVPANGVALSSAANGTELQTPFVLSTTNWTDAYLPLQFSFSYSVLNTSVDGVSSASTLLADFSNETTVSSVLLPAGTVMLQVWARNALGGVSLAPATTTVVVSRQVFVSADAQANFISTLLSTSRSGPLTAADATATVALVSSIAGMLNDPGSLLNNNATAAADTRANLLNLVDSAAALAITPEALASAADAVNTLVSNASQISAAGAATALGVLETISSGGAGGAVAISPAASAGVAASLSSVASAALAPNSPVSPAVLERVSNVVSSLATSLLTALSTPGAAPVTVSSPLIQLSVALDVVGPDSRLFSAPLTAPGSKSSFAPLPADIFAGTSRRRRLLADDPGVRTQFSSLAFDPHTQDPNSTGTTTLAFSDATAGELDISGLSAPIMFTLPRVPLADGRKALCQFWDKTAAAFSIVGCVSLPDPLPRGHNVSWKPGFTAASDAEMAGAWSIAGPLVAAPSRCMFEVLDCSVANSTRSVYPNPAKPFQFPAVSCNASISTEPILVISGSTCSLIQEDNAYGCYWNNSKHAFQGAGCLASGGPVQCACRHLTEFTGKSAPSLPTASLSDMLGLNPADIVTKLKLLFEVVIILFGIMNVGAAVGGVMDRRERVMYLEKLQQPHMGYRVAEDGAWLWSFSVEPMRDIIDAPNGPAVEICELLGIPFARLRFALPDEMLSWDMSVALGRTYGLSRSGWEATAADLKEKLPSLFGSFRRSRSRRISQLDPAVVKEMERARQAMVTMEEFVGTAIVLAFLQVAALMPVAQLAERGSAAARHFDSVRTAFGRDFSTTRVDFVTLLSPGVLNMASKWLPRARLWKLILSQSTTGYWDASSTTALVLEARAAAEVTALPKTLLMRVVEFFKSLTESMAEADAAGDGDDGPDGRHEQDDLDELFEMCEGEEEDDETPRVQRHHKLKPLTDCPINNSAEAIPLAMPRALAKLAVDASSTVTLRRVWTTMCCIAVLERLVVCWVWGDGDLYAPEERTIVDAGREWIEARAAEWPMLACALEDEKVMKAARKTTANWGRAWEQRVNELRASPALRNRMGRSHVHRTAIGITRAMVAKNDTFRTFLAEPLDGLQRWQMFMIMVTLIIGQLLVNIWMFYAKAVNCCAEVVAILDSGPDGGNCATPADCRGFTGNCADIVDQFADLPVLPDFPDGMAEYTCTAFPNDDNPIDSFIVGLISIAIALPASLFLASCFMIANDSEAPESWLEWFGWRKLVFGPNAHRRWHYTGPLGQPVRHVKWFIRSVGAPQPETAINLWHSLVSWVTGSDPPWVEEWREAIEAEAAEEAEMETEVSLHGYGTSYAAKEDDGSDSASTSSSVRSARALARYKRAIALTGFIGVYVTWALFAWFIFVYGMLIYKLLGDQVQSEFARSWGVSYGMNAASEWKDVVTEAMKGAILLAILERLYITRSNTWIEEHIDYYCIQSQLFGHATLNFVGQARVLWKHTKRISDD